MIGSCYNFSNMKYCTAINCMDGRVQLPVIMYLQARFNAQFVDMITEPGPNKILTEGEDDVAVQSILARARISTDKHSSQGIAVVGHYHCAGNPAGKAEQIAQIEEAVQFLRHEFRDIEVIGLWVDENWRVHEQK